ncbi:MAG: hypothetical protein WDN69_15580 [Aliidongia sp.]
MLVVLGILGVLALTVTGGLSASLPALRLRAATRILADDLRATRRMAMLQEREATLFVMPDRYASSDGTRPEALPPGTRLSLAEVPRNRGETADRVRFFSDGSSTGGRLQLWLGERHSAIAIDWLTGRVRVDE